MIHPIKHFSGMKGQPTLGGSHGLSNSNYTS